MDSSNLEWTTELFLKLGRVWFNEHNELIHLIVMVELLAVGSAKVFIDQQLAASMDSLKVGMER